VTDCILPSLGFHITSAHQPLKTMPTMTATCIQYGCHHHTCENIPVHKWRYTYRLQLSCKNCYSLQKHK